MVSIFDPVHQWHLPENEIWQRFCAEMVSYVLGRFFRIYIHEFFKHHSITSCLLPLLCLLASCISCIRCQQLHLAKFRAAVPQKGLYDLSANVDKRCRTETQHKLLPCLTTSSQLWLLVQWVTNIYGHNYFSIKNGVSVTHMSQIINHKSLTIARPFSAHRCDKKKRLMLGEEQLAALGYPCLKELAKEAKVEPWLDRTLVGK